MISIQKILFPTDFSECAEHAFARAADLASRFEAELHVLNVVPADVVDPDNPMQYLDDVGAPTPVPAMPRLGRVEDVRVLHAQSVGATESQGILDYARAHDVDVIVMGTHGRRGFGRLFLGSVAEEVVRMATCPVLTVCVASDEEKHRPVRRILAPVDFSESSQAVLIYAKELAAAYEAHLDIVHVIAEVTLPGVYGIEPVPVASEEVKDRVQEALEAEVDAAPGARVAYEVHVVVGYPIRDIADFAGQHQTDLIVLATHGRTGLKRLVMGSVAENVVRLAPCPVLTLKSFGKSLVTTAPRRASTVDA